jgi:hypothetical protein
MFKKEVLDRLADALAERLEDRSLGLSLDEDGKVMGIDPWRLYTVSQVAERLSVSEKTVRRNLPRADWNGSGVRIRGIDILRYEGVDVEPPSPPSSPRQSVEDDDDPPPPGGDGRTYDGTLPEL